MKQSLPVPLSVIFHEECTGVGGCGVVGGRTVLDVLDGALGVGGVVTLSAVAVDCPSVEDGGVVITVVVVVGGGVVVVVVVVVTVVAAVVVVGNVVVVTVETVEESVAP